SPDAEPHSLRWFPGGDEAFADARMGTHARALDAEGGVGRHQTRRRGRTTSLRGPFTRAGAPLRIPNLETIGVNLKGGSTAPREGIPSIPTCSFVMTASQAAHISPLPGPPNSRETLLTGRRTSRRLARMSVRRAFLSIAAASRVSVIRPTPNSPGSHSVCNANSADQGA